jgi:HK97 family phage portal protein
MPFAKSSVRLGVRRMRVNWALSLFYNVNHPQIGWGVTLHQDATHIRGLTVGGGYLRMTPIDVARDVVRLALAKHQHDAILFRRGAQLNGIVKHPARFGKKARNGLPNLSRMSTGGAERLRTAVVEKGASLEKLTRTDEDNQFRQTWQFHAIVISGMFGIQPHKASDLSKANSSTLEVQEQQCVNVTLHRLAANFHDRCKGKLFFEDEFDRYRIRVDFERLLRGRPEGTREILPVSAQ